MLQCSFTNVYLLFQVHKQVGHVRIGYWCVKEWPQPLYEQIYELSMFVLILLLPLSVMSFAYASICKELWLVVSNRANLRAGEGCVSIMFLIQIYFGHTCNGRVVIRLGEFLFNLRYFVRVLLQLCFIMILTRKHCNYRNKSIIFINFQSFIMRIHNIVILIAFLILGVQKKTFI